jgi:hypothetical protein
VKIAAARIDPGLGSEASHDPSGLLRTTRRLAISGVATAVALAGTSGRGRVGELSLEGAVEVGDPNERGVVLGFGGCCEGGVEAGKGPIEASLASVPGSGDPFSRTKNFLAPRGITLRWPTSWHG